MIGSDPASHVVLTAEGVSRRHAILDVESPYLRIVDQESKNGTWVNGARTSNALLRPGDEIKLGTARFRLEAVDPGDLELALDLTEEHPTAEEATAIATPTTTIVHLSADASLGHWLSISCSFLDRLQEFEGGVRALGMLTEQLGARGACIVELRDSQEPTILALFGRVEASLLEQLATQWHDERRGGAAPPETFISEPGVTGLLRRPGDVAWAIFVAGDFRGRRASRPLLSTLLHHYLYATSDRREPVAAAPAPDPILKWPPGFVRCRSDAMEELYTAMKPLVTAELPVLITGETGTGKEMVARSLHLSRHCSSAPFVAINCAAIPADLLEAELFGIEDGVASGVNARVGKFEAARDGTLFLDEVSSMPAELQSKLLRVLQEKEIHPLGSPPVPLRARLVAATNASASELLAGETFRSDLFFRLAGAVLHIPPLRERRSDVPLLVDGLLRAIARDLGKELRGLSVAALTLLVRHDWPGNVRELEHELRRLAHLCAPRQPILSTMLAERLRGVSSPPNADSLRGEAFPDTRASSGTAGDDRVTATALPTLELGALESLAIQEAMEQTGSNQARAAELLGISRFALHRRLKKQDSNDS